MANKKYSVIISDAALRFSDEILDKIESLETNPIRYPSYDNDFVPENRYRKMTVNKRYMVLYEISGDSVFVDYIIDCRQNLELLLV